MTTDLMQELGVLALPSRLKRLSDSLIQEGARVYASSGVKFEPRWFPVFVFLYRRGPTAITGVAKGLGISHPAVNKMANELIAARLVAPYRDRNDKRKRVLALTSVGREKAKELEPVWAQIQETLQGLLDDSSSEFLGALDSLEVNHGERGFFERFQSTCESQPDVRADDSVQR